MNEQTLALQQQAQPGNEITLLGSVTNFEAAQRMAVMLSKSTMVPLEYRENPSNCIIALEYANRLKESPFLIMQNMHTINGRPGLKSEYLAARINESKKYDGELKYKYEGAEGTDERACTVWARERDGSIVEGQKVTVRMAKAEGWYERKGSKWPNMTDQMLGYRAVSFFKARHFPGIAFGMKTIEEIQDIPFEDVSNSSTISDLNNKVKQAAPVYEQPRPVQEPQRPQQPQAQALQYQQPPAPQTFQNLGPQGPQFAQPVYDITPQQNKAPQGPPISNENVI